MLDAPELDDLHDTDNLSPLPLVAPGERRTAPSAGAEEGAGEPATAGVRRKSLASMSAAKGRLLIAAMATGAAAAAAYSALHTADTEWTSPILAADEATISVGATQHAAGGVELITVKTAGHTAEQAEAFVKAAAFAHERAEREARLQRPLFVLPTRGIPTSGFGYRWGALHGGIDVANSIGTPIYAVSDGVVIETGPWGGYGGIVRLRHSDGTVTLYAHVNTATVNVGQRVMAGDQIATMGNSGNSTGPHLHFEVLLSGSNQIDPVPWLAKRGLSVGGFTG